MTANPYAWNPHGSNFKVRGAAVLQREEKKRNVKGAEKAEKQKVRDRDKTCRWPRCKPKTRLECAHIEDKGMGGDKGTRSTADQMIQLCFTHHQGPVSIHSKDLKVEPETAKGADGPVSFWQRDEDGNFFMVAREVSVGVTERQARKKKPEAE